MEVVYTQKNGSSQTWKTIYNHVEPYDIYRMDVAVYIYTVFPHIFLSMAYLTV